MEKKRIIAAITGASGVICGIRIVEILADIAEIHLIVSDAAMDVIELETSYSYSRIASLAHKVYDNDDFTAPIASGSFPTDGMIISPCTIKTLSAVANCYSASLISRAADVVLKERKPLVLCVRETPFSPGHLNLMIQASQMGALICPPVISMYSKPQTISQLVDHTVGRQLDLLGIRTDFCSRWTGVSVSKEKVDMQESCNWRHEAL